MSRPTTTVEDAHLAVGEGPVDAVTARVHRPAGDADGRRPALLLTHGAGGDLDGSGLVALAEAVAEGGSVAVRCNLPHREAGMKASPRAERAVGWFADLAASARDLLGTSRLVVGGKSYGGRVASMAVADGLDAAGLLFYGYPLHPPGKPDLQRVRHWPAITVPCLFLQGTRDPFCNLDLLDIHLPRLGGPATLEVVEGGDHSLRVAGKHAPDGEPASEAATMRRLGSGPVLDWLRTLR